MASLRPTTLRPTTLRPKTGVSLFLCLEDDEDLIDPHTHRPHYSRGVLPEVAQFAVFGGVVDGSSFEWLTLVACLESVANHLVECPDRACYVHCFGGHGRAGIVAACILGLAYGLPPKDALSYTQHAHDQREDPAWPLQERQSSPQTAVQVAQVENLLTAVATEKGGTPQQTRRLEVSSDSYMV